MENTLTKHKYAPYEPKTASDSSLPYASKREQRLVFFFVCVGIVSLTYALFYVIDFLPEAPTDEISTDTEVVSNFDEDLFPLINDNTELTTPTQNALIPQDAKPLPLAIIFDSLDGKEVKVINPESSSVTALDTALLSGAVRHPDSADFSERGTVFLLGHSSYLPNVRNKNFQAFNGIGKLVWGDTIRVQTQDTEYVYSVDRVYEAKASSAEVPIQHDVAKLVLATCNSFATKDDRFIVEATLVDSYPRAVQGG